MNHKLWSQLFLAGSFAALVFGTPVCQIVSADPPRPTLPIENSDAKAPDQMKAYTELIEHTSSKIDLVPIPGGTFTMGSPASEAGRKEDEGPQHEVKVDPFWMSKFEITWEVYEVWMFDLDIQRRELAKKEINDRDKAANEYQISQPTQPYTDMTFGMGKTGYPAICMTQFAARTFCQWLSAKTGRYYRLPTEAEWEYACRAGTKTAYHFGDDPADLEKFAWFYDNADEKYHKVGQKKANPWGLHDMHGNVQEWVLDQYEADGYSKFKEKLNINPLIPPRSLFPQVARGGSWQDNPESLRSASRVASEESWQKQDPQIPKSIWYHTDALHVGFRIIRPLTEPSDKEKETKFDVAIPGADRKSGR